VYVLCKTVTGMIVPPLVVAPPPPGFAAPPPQVVRVPIDGKYFS